MSKPKANELVVVHVNWRPHRATNHTKNRVREHGPKFKLVAGPKVPAFDRRRRPHLLLVSLRPLRGGDHWAGWLPENEITIDVIDDG